MHIVEFEADAEKDIIRIPENYKELYSKRLKIIVMIKNEERQISQIESELDEFENKKFLEANYNAVIKNDSEEDKIWEKYL